MKKKVLSVISISCLLALCGCSPIYREKGSEYISSNGNSYNSGSTITSGTIDEEGLYYPGTEYFVEKINSSSIDVVRMLSTKIQDEVKPVFPQDYTNVYDKDFYQGYTIGTPDLSYRNIEEEGGIPTLKDFFNIHNKITIDVDLSEETLEKLQESFLKYKNDGKKSEKYYHADSVTISIENYSTTYKYTFKDVGIRQKGNMSREHMPVYVDDEIKEFHFKLSFDETWTDSTVYSNDELYNWANQSDLLARDNRNFLGLSGLDFKVNYLEDESNLREIYASMLYRANGVLSQSITLGNVNMVNLKDSSKKNMGVYTVYEPASKTMIKRKFAEGYYDNLPTWMEEKVGSNGVANSKYGDLYKCGWGKGDGSSQEGCSMRKDSYSDKKIGVNNATGSYYPAYNRKTNLDANDNNERLRSILNTINDSSNISSIEEVVDLKYFAIEEAVSYVVGSPDDLRNNFNNYMIYIRRTDGKMMIIPIDLDRAFASGAGNWDPGDNAMSETQPFSTRAVGNNKDQINPLLNKTLLVAGDNPSSNSSKVNIYQAHYLNQIKAIKASSWGNKQLFEDIYHIAELNYASTSRVPFSLDGTSSSKQKMSFENYLTSKMSKVDLAYAMNSTQGGEDPLPDDPVYGDEAPYKDVYLCGINSWAPNKDYPMVYKGNGIYEGTIPNISFEEVSFKFNDGTGWDKLNWGKGSDGKLSLSSGENFTFSGLTEGQDLTIVINLNDMSVTYRQG